LLSYSEKTKDSGASI